MSSLVLKRFSGRFQLHTKRNSGTCCASRESTVSVCDLPKLMLLRIVKIPPASMLEGLDLSPLKLRRNETRDIRSPIADVLVAWGYAKKVARTARPIKKPRLGRGK